MSVSLETAAAAAVSSPRGSSALVERDERVYEQGGGKLAAYVELTKPRIAVMVVFTVAVGFLLGARGSAHPIELLMAIGGVGLVAAGATVWNQVMEKERDSRMRRTAKRPIPSGRLGSVESAVFASVMTLIGLGMLLAGPHPISAAVALATFLLYVLAYTPLKPVTTLNTAVGAIPGALPPVIGWAAATGELGIEPWALFLIMFLWQFPHFLAIAWIYREDYMMGGLKMLPVVDPTGRMTGRQAAAYALALVPASLLPVAVGLAGPFYFAGALALSAYYLAAALRFSRDVNETTARKLLRASFVYLPLTLLLLLLNPLPI